jgi:hypothetical protein
MAEQQPGGIQIPWKYYTNLFLSISAYDRWKQDDIFDLVESAFHQFVEPHSSRPGFVTRLIWSALRKEGGLRPSISGVGHLAKLRKRSNVAQLFVSIESENERTAFIRNMPASVEAIVITPNENSPQFHYSVSLQPHTLSEDVVPVDIQHGLVEHAKRAFARLLGVVGYITVDVVSGCFSWSPYERWLGAPDGPAYDFHTKERLFYRRTRGYYWGNFLNSSHVDILGGEQALSKSPVALIERLENGWYLQLTDDINDIDLGRLHELRDFLAPVLPVAHPRYAKRLPDFEKTLPPFVL